MYSFKDERSKAYTPGTNGIPPGLRGGIIPNGFGDGGANGGWSKTGIPTAIPLEPTAGIQPGGIPINGGRLKDGSFIARGGRLATEFSLSRTTAFLGRLLSEVSAAWLPTIGI